MTHYQATDIEITKSSQNVEFTGLYSFQEVSGISGPAMIRVTIRSNSYQDQCFARIHVWSPTTLSWNQVWHTPIGAMEPPTSLYVAPDWQSKMHFQADAVELLRKASQVLIPSGPQTMAG